MEFLTTLKVAEKPSVSRRRVLALVQAGKLPAKKFGRDYMIREKDLKLVVNGKVGRPKKIS